MENMKGVLLYMGGDSFNGAGMKLLKILGVAVVVLGMSAFAGYHLFFKLSVPDYTGTNDQ